MSGRKKKRSSKIGKTGFTIVEILAIVVVIAILTVISGVIYIGLQKRASSAVVMDTLKKATNEVLVKKVSNNSLPTTIEGMFDLPGDVILDYTDTSTEGGLPQYSGLTAPENGRLFYDICRQQVTDGLGSGPNDFGSGTINYISACNVYDLHYLQINGWNGGFNVSNPSVTEDRLQAYVDASKSSHPDHPSYTATLQNFMDKLTNRFNAQGGTFPITSFWQPWIGAPTLPPPSSITTSLSGFCIVGSSVKYPDVSFVTSLKNPVPKPGTECI